ncbi:MAG: Lrp/AsnC family transcriptional regulator [Gemmatimonadaceae bacterium]|nr:Lrp/AsnC family transcriptional regulator [Gemmatimonadaceae bacterium]NUQ91417.1 Lrp/AsnC family transcriptional regulator [Gemmatimonadaceae bacterium]NUR20986.1 Lrp/AsnC family transcriptional regulator [Gemmatimonadaceae bacterium]NUS97205.1 Lrp/AsnC family transcriptional regulator [Gemmatimonadaceae bacterium]
MTAVLPTEITDPVNARILAVSEDRIAGFLEDPFAEIARLAELPAATVHERIRAMLEAKTIRRVRQTLMATNLAPGALIAWNVPAVKLDAAFEYMAKEDPFSGHVVIRSTDAETTGSVYRLWTTLKVPVGFSMRKHADLLARTVGAEGYRIMPAKRLFALGVGHVRRKGMEPGARTDEPGRVLDTTIVQLSPLDWRVLVPLKRELAPDEIGPEPWRARAAEAGVSYQEFLRVAQSLAARGVIGRFSTFLEHVKPSSAGTRVTRYNALFHWRVPPGREIEAGKEVGRHHILTHAYWREGGDEFAHVNIMAVAHGTEKGSVLAHKAAIDEHLDEAGIPVLYTNVFWGGRSEIKPSEIAPTEYEAWCRRIGIDPATMRAEPGEASESAA